jgi:hypothetical protein
MVYVLSFNFAFPPLDAFENSGKNFPYFCANGKNHEIMKLWNCWDGCTFSGPVLKREQVQAFSDNRNL